MKKVGKTASDIRKQLRQPSRGKDNADTFDVEFFQRMAE